MVLFIRWNDLTDKLVGKAVRGKRPVIHWPEKLNVFKRTYNWFHAGTVIVVAASLSLLVSGHFFLSISFSSPLSGVAFWMGVVSAILLFVGAMMIVDRTYVDEKQFAETSEIIEPLYSKRPYLDLRLAAFLTVGAMPKWLLSQMDSEKTPDWQEARLAEEPYTVERAGLDYLELASSIELWDKPPCGSFHGKSFPGVNYRLPGSLKDAVGEIILFLSALPNSVGEPDEETMEAVVKAIDRLATIDGESFTTAVQRGYNGEIMKIVDASTDAMDAKSGRHYEAIQRGMSKLSKINRASKLSREPAAAGLDAAAATMR